MESFGEACLTEECDVIVINCMCSWVGCFSDYSLNLHMIVLLPSSIWVKTPAIGSQWWERGYSDLCSSYNLLWIDESSSVCTTKLTGEKRDKERSVNEDQSQLPAFYIYSRSKYGAAKAQCVLKHSGRRQVSAFFIVLTSLHS